MNHLIIENDNGKVYLDQHIGKLVNFKQVYAS